MVDTTSGSNMANQDIDAADYRMRRHAEFVRNKIATENRMQINSTADKWWSNMQAVIKLRQKGTTNLNKLPSGVFRHMLEYKFPNEFCWRYSEPYGPI